MDEESSDDDLSMDMPDIFSGAAATTILTPRKALKPTINSLSPLPDITNGNHRRSPMRARLSLNTLLTEKRSAGKNKFELRSFRRSLDIFM